MAEINPTKTLTLPYYKLTFGKRIVALFKAHDKHVAEIVARAYARSHIAAAKRINKKSTITKDNFNLKHCKK